MLWPEHILLGYIMDYMQYMDYMDYMGNYGFSTNRRETRYKKPETKTLDIVMGSILPDVFMVLLWMFRKEVDVVDMWTRCFYFLPHSMLVLPLVPRKWRAFYALHILCDVVSHTGEWSIRLLYPLTNFSIEGFYDPWKWVFR